MKEQPYASKSRLEAITENPGDKQGAEQAFRHWFVDRLHQGLVHLQQRLVIRSCGEKCDKMYDI